jgi:hypothetical protein
VVSREREVSVDDEGSGGIVAAFRRLSPAGVLEGLGSGVVKFGSVVDDEGASSRIARATRRCRVPSTSVHRSLLALLWGPGSGPLKNAPAVAVVVVDRGPRAGRA